MSFFYKNVTDMTHLFFYRDECKTIGSTCMKIQAWTNGSAAHIRKHLITTPAAVISHAMRYDRSKYFVLYEFSSTALGI